MVAELRKEQPSDGLTCLITYLLFSSKVCGSELYSVQGLEDDVPKCVGAELSSTVNVSFFTFLILSRVLCSHYHLQIAERVLRVGCVELDLVARGISIFTIVVTTNHFKLFPKAQHVFGSRFTYVCSPWRPFTTKCRQNIKL